MSLKIIVGLGNPGKEYEGTRHNAGFMFLDAFVGHKEIASADKEIIFSLEKKFEAKIAEVLRNGEKIILVKPQTFMNQSGKAVAAILNFYKAEAKDLIVAADDIDLPVGTARIRKEGGSAGQKGLQNIIDSIGNNEFVRIRIGIGSGTEPFDKAQSRQSNFETAEYVLGRIGKREMPIIENVIKSSCDYILEYLGTKQEIPSHTIESTPDSL